LVKLLIFWREPDIASRLQVMRIWSLSKFRLATISARMISKGRKMITAECSQIHRGHQKTNQSVSIFGPDRGLIDTKSIKSNGTSPEDVVELIFQHTGRRFEIETAMEVWPRIEQHQRNLAEKLNRDVGLKIACLDYLENIEPTITELGGRIIETAIWDSIPETQLPKKILHYNVILPLKQTALAQKHRVVPPRTIILFGPPGTGKTHFVHGIAGILQWKYVEVSPSALMAEGEPRLGANLKEFMAKVRYLDKVVVFIDEFEEIAANRDNASRIDKSVTNEFLKQVPLLKKQGEDILLICATKHIRKLDKALLRPGRFDYIIPVGPLDRNSILNIFENHLARTNRGDVDVLKIVSMLDLFTPADIEYLFLKVRQHSFQKEYERQEDYRVTTETFLEIIPFFRPTLTQEMMEDFQKDCEQYTRY